MSLKERDRLALMRRVEDRQMTLKEASQRLKVSYRQGKRLWQAYRVSGDAGLVHVLSDRPGRCRPPRIKKGPAPS